MFVFLSWSEQVTRNFTAFCYNIFIFDAKPVFIDFNPIFLRNEFLLLESGQDEREMFSHRFFFKFVSFRSRLPPKISKTK